MNPSNNIIHGLWIGKYLSPLERLTIRSFLDHGHEFHLWLYEPLDNPLPDMVKVKDANEIIPASAVFRYEQNSTLGHGKGSVAGFSDLFRYKLLHQHGGWWSDMDVTCLQGLDVEADYLFRSHFILPAVGNLMKAPKGCLLMQYCYERTQDQVNATNTDWLLPIRILNEGIQKFNLQAYIRKDISNEDYWYDIEPFIFRKKEIPISFHALHWMNEEWNTRGLDKQIIRKASALGRLMVKHEVLAEEELSQLALRSRLRNARFTVSTKTINWLKKPGFPVFLKRWWSK